MKMSDFMVV